LTSAMIISDVSQETLYPGKQANLQINIENNLNTDVKDVSLNLNFEKIPVTPVGSSEDSVDKIKEDDDENLDFTIKAANDAVPGNYEIPYVLTYKDENVTITKAGTIGVVIRADPIIDFSYEIENNIIGSKGSVNIKIINKGLYDARFVNLEASASGLTILTDSSVYIGTVDSDDFDSASFDVIFNSKNPKFNIELEYLDFDNNKQTTNQEFDLKAYTQEEAIQKGIINKSNTFFYFTIIILLLIVWLVYRKIKKNRKEKLKKQNLMQK